MYNFPGGKIDCFHFGRKNVISFMNQVVRLFFQDVFRAFYWFDSEIRPKILRFHRDQKLNVKNRGK